MPATRWPENAAQGQAIPVDAPGRLMYTAFYNLNEPPFRLTPDPRYLFLSEKHREALAHLIFGIRQGSGFAVITGEIGTGKTTLIRALLRDAEPDTLSAYVFNPALSGCELLQTINQEFGLPVFSTTKELVDCLNRFLLEQKRAGRNPVVIVDEAQALSPQVLEQLRLLSNLETETEKLLQIVLVGQPQLTRLLGRPDLAQLKQRIGVNWHLGALGRGETAGYVRHRLSVACSGRRRRIFSAAALAAIHAYSRGVPRMINMICDRALLIGYTRERGRIGARTIRRAVSELTMERARTWSSLAQSFLYSAVIAAAFMGAVVVFSAADADRQKERASLGERAPAPSAARLLPSPGPAAAEGEAAPASTDILSTQGAAAVTSPSGAPPAASAELERDRLVRRLMGMTRTESAMSAVSELLKLWKAPPLDHRERHHVPLDLAAVATRRGLELLAVSGTWERLRLLDLPAILELVLGEAHERRSVSLVATSGGRATLAISEERIVVSLEDLSPFWHGDASVLWRDYEALPALMGPGWSGAEVGRLQSLLGEAGVVPALSSWYYDRATEQLVAQFQQHMGIGVDGIVGPLTKILLYQKAPRYGPPRLGTGERL